MLQAYALGAQACGILFNFSIKKVKKKKKKRKEKERKKEKKRKEKKERKKNKKKERKKERKKFLKRTGVKPKDPKRSPEGGITHTVHTKMCLKMASVMKMFDAQCSRRYKISETKYVT